MMLSNRVPLWVARATSTTVVALAAISSASAQAPRTGNTAEPAWLTAIRTGQVRKSREIGVHAMGALPSSETSLAHSARFTVRAVSRGERPASVLLTDFLPPVASQGQQGSCAAWSSAYYCYTYAVSQRRGLSADRIAANEELRFSPAFLYHQGNGGQDRGMPISRAFQILHEYGCASLVEMPYSESDFTSPPDQAAIDRAARFKARDTGLLFRLGEADPERLKTYLAEARQPFVMAIPILVDFPQTPVAPDFVYRPTVSLTPQTVRGLHAVTVVGYDDAHHAFRIVNSWGPRWGDHGFLWIDEDFVRAVGLDGYAVAAGGILSRDPSGRVRIAKDISLTPPGTAD